ncbi:MAG: c-type cytochrome, partial [Burkholderiales bacterium]|nr:c-type cytochrome [Burkholderiales bacterium]
MAYSPKTGLVYIPAQELPFGFADDGKFEYNPEKGAWNLANTSALNGGPKSEAERQVLKARTRGQLIAWDPVEQREVWRVQHPSAGYGGVLATGGNLVFQGGPDGKFHAYRADTGQRVWTADGKVGIIAGAMTFMAKGEQYIAVLSGLGGSNGLHVPYIQNPRAGPGRILVYKLNGEAELPAGYPPILPANVPQEEWPAETVAKGEGLYGANCLLCHGFGAISNGVVPDLRRTPMLSSRAAFEHVVLGGALVDTGMPNWSGKLDAKDVDAIRAYLADRAKQLQRDEDLAIKGGKTAKK